jgi:cellulose synthase/poly-beta-1,6-N-acetylglucosamine synthase-like glycosyltransferase
MVSIIVPTHQRADMLPGLLAALQSLDYPRYEVILVDDASSDGTAAYLEEVAQQWPALRLHHRSTQGGPAAARNDGLKLARGELVAFTDDDCRPEADWLKRLVEELQASSERVGGVGGTIKSLTPRTWIGVYVHLAQRHQGHLRGEESPYLDTANALYRRDVLEAVRGFDLAFFLPGAEDVDLSLRVKGAGWELRRAPRAVVGHLEQASLRRIFQQSFRFGQGMGILRERYPHLFTGQPSRGIARWGKGLLARWQRRALKVVSPTWRRRLLRWHIAAEETLRTGSRLVRFLIHWPAAQRRFQDYGWTRSFCYTALDGANLAIHCWGECVGRVAARRRTPRKAPRGTE